MLEKLSIWCYESDLVTMHPVQLISRKDQMIYHLESSETKR